MLAAGNEYLSEASNTMYLMSADEHIRKQCLDREEYYQDLRSHEREIAKLRDALAQQNDDIAHYLAQIQSLTEENEKLQKQLQ